MKTSFEQTASSLSIRERALIRSLHLEATLCPQSIKSSAANIAGGK